MKAINEFLLKNKIGNVVINAKQFPENTPENAENWIYLSEKFEEYALQEKIKLLKNILNNPEYIIEKINDAIAYEETRLFILTINY